MTKCKVIKKNLENFKGLKSIRKVFSVYNKMKLENNKITRKVCDRLWNN